MFILHHYPPSPVSEKVRVILGLKDLAWKSVEIPRLPPRPLLFPMTAGYRRTPVLQCGADIYCDSSCIISELERRVPEPSIRPGGRGGLIWAANRWSDQNLFHLSLGVLFGAQAHEMPEEFAKDRGAIYFGKDFDLATLGEKVPQFLDQLRAQLVWLNDRISDDWPYILGQEPALPDASVYYTIWFLRGRWKGGPDFLKQFPNIEAWEARIQAIGNGHAEDMAGEDALAIARDAAPDLSTQDDPGDPRGLKPGDRIAIRQVGSDADPDVEGTILRLEPERITIHHEAPECGEVSVTFPRLGYDISKR